MLTVDQYNSLDASERIIILEDFGVYLETYYHSQGCKVALFSLYSFYVEVWLHKKTDSIVTTVGFTDYCKLDKFLKGIDLTPVLG